MYIRQSTLALSPFGYLVSSLGGLLTGVGMAFVLWHLF